MDFLRLKLTGFKSFVESSELVIEPGLTGVIGPNGCGKSNLLESLRWIMGASSAKALRGQDMDDVIFAGTQSRNALRWAEVSLLISGALGKAQAPFHDQDVLEVKRRIHRGEGSTYRINNKEVRAKDVQLLFADASTGANSPALVRQGQIADLIASKPSNRRRVLEEAANISGLSGRRTEAEHRLNAAEANLSRLDDAHQSLEANLTRLKKEARQAEVFRKLSNDIRTLTKAHFLARFDKVNNEFNFARSAAVEAEHNYRSLNSDLSLKVNAFELLESGTALIEEEHLLAQSLSNRLMLKEERLNAETAELAREAKRLSDDKERLKRDHERSIAFIKDAKSEIEALQALMQENVETSDDNIQSESNLKLEYETSVAQLKKAEGDFETLSKLYHSAKERARSESMRLAEATNRLERMTLSLKEVEGQKLALQAQESVSLKLEDDAKKIEQFNAEIQTLIQSITLLEAQKNLLEAPISNLETTLSEKRSAKSALEGELAGLKKLLEANKRDQNPISDLIEIQKGYELALASSLGDDLNWGISQSHDQTAIGFWNQDCNIEIAIKLFDQWGISPLEDFVRAYPPILRARLMATGLVSSEQGNELQKHLPLGVRLVSREGDLWRWDGLCIRARAPKPAAIRLSQRNRLMDIETALKTLEVELVSVQTKLETTQSDYNQHVAEIKKIQTQLQLTEKAYRSANESYGHAFAKAQGEKARIEAINESFALLSSERLIAFELWQSLQNLNSEHNDNVPSEETLNSSKSDLKNAQDAVHKARSQLEWFQREKDLKLKRQHQWMKESAQWAGRIQTAENDQKRILLESDELAIRTNAFEAKTDELRPMGHILAEEKIQIEQRLHKARNASEAHKLALSEASLLLKNSEKAASQSKEALNSLSIKANALAESLKDIENTILFETKQTPDELRNDLKTTPHSVPRDISGLEDLIEGLKTQRNQMGSVNLRAEDDAKEAQNALGLLTDERNDLLVAIKKLRHAIEALNSEGRAKLSSAFDIINEHFKSLFITLFEGGTASLALVESEDPLKAGLEIFACPPGKRLSTISLMSGGEQALTATALIFAVFLANPAPVCVLDEVDAPLDDANVERYCALLDAMRQKTKTRFLVITHNPVTMSKMDRLFGVTMQEGGVSQLFSLRLEAAKALITAEQDQRNNQLKNQELLIS